MTIRKTFGVAVLLLGLMVLVFVPGCSDDDDDDSKKSNSPIVGSWTIDTQVIVGQGVNGNIQTKTARFADDHTGYLKQVIVEYIQGGTSTTTNESTMNWSVTSDSLTVSLFSDVPILPSKMAYTVANDTLTLDYHTSTDSGNIQIIETYYPASN